MKLAWRRFYSGLHSKTEFIVEIEDIDLVAINDPYFPKEYFQQLPRGKVSNIFTALASLAKVIEDRAWGTGEITYVNGEVVDDDAPQLGA